MNGRNLIVHINGWPGTGKLTIGRILAARLGARLIDNHTLINPAEMLFSRRDPLYRSLRGELRRIVFDHITRSEPGASFIFTDALSDDDFDMRQFEAYRDLARRRSAKLVAVVIECEEQENLKRLASPGRAERLKLTKPEILRDLRAKHRLLRAEADNQIELDVTGLSAVDAAAAMESHLT